MQTLRYKTGIWNVEAQLQQVDENKRLAVISAMAGEGKDAMQSKHTVVFEHTPGCDELEETKAYAQRILMNTY